MGGFNTFNNKGGLMIPFYPFPSNPYVYNDLTIQMIIGLGAVVVLILLVMWVFSKK